MAKPKPEATAMDEVQNDHIRELEQKLGREPTKMEVDALRETFKSLEDRFDALVADYEHGVKHSAPKTQTFLDRLRALVEELKIR